MATLTYIFKVSLYDMFVATTFASFLSEFGKNLSYNSCDTVIFVNSDLGLHFQGQMISRFCCWLRCYHCGKKMYYN